MTNKNHDEQETTWKRRWTLKLLAIGITIRLSTLALLMVLPRWGAPCFDCSATKHAALEGWVRWDTLHFLSMARRGGHSVEQEWAFGSGIIQVLKLGGWMFRPILGQTDSAMIVGAVVWAVAASVGSSVILFFLTMKLTNSIEFSTLSSLLHLFSPSPSTQVVPYTEPFFAFFSFLGTYFYARWVSSATIHAHQLMIKVGVALCWSVATAFRPIGALQSAFWAWELLEALIRLLPPYCYRISKVEYDPKHCNSSVPRQRSFNGFFRSKIFNHVVPYAIIGGLEAVLLSLITCSPFLWDQWTGYRKFCLIPHTEKREWCSRLIPAIYPFVQSHYWGVGFLKYWTFQQLPLFVISAPMYFVAVAGGVNHWVATLSPSSPSPHVSSKELMSPSPFCLPQLHSHVALHCLLSGLLLFNSHVQIILRQACTMPVFWWGLADGIGHQWGWWSGHRLIKSWTWWFKWCSLWSIISIVLWAGFYPPA